MKSAPLFLWETAKIIILALAIVLPIRYFIFQPFIVRGESMEPNFHNGDYLIVDEISYRFREPQRGEVVVFHYPGNPSEKFIKRIVALPGEQVEIKNSQITIIGKFSEKIILDESKYLQSPIMLEEKKIALNENEYLVLGDNRLHSFDSRNWGALSKDFIIGKAIFRLFPPKIIASFLQPEY